MLPKLEDQLNSIWVLEFNPNSKEFYTGNTLYKALSSNKRQIEEKGQVEPWVIIGIYESREAMLLGQDAVKAQLDSYQLDLFD
jgi:hypothetical protein